MKIDERVEPAVREAFGAAVAGEADPFDQAIERIGARGDDFVRDAVNLGLAICAAALYSLHQGRRPDDEQLADLARSFNEAEDWAEIIPDASVKFLGRVGGPDTDHGGRPARRHGASDIRRGRLAAVGVLPGDAEWTNFLSRILNRLESAPA